ncbi:MAG: response regulator [Candidatus Omnitrophota bacterium]|jgi:two-component system alkaline phosphatase synthesis response regulator PhoP
MEKKKILIIDDEENFAKLVKKNIERTGEFEAYTATNGEDGLKLVRELKPDLVLLDMIMPDMDGADVATQIRDDESIKDTSIVFLTAMVRPDETDPRMGFTKGYSLVSKTVTVKELLACIKENIKY